MIFTYLTFINYKCFKQKTNKTVTTLDFYVYNLYSWFPKGGPWVNLNESTRSQKNTLKNTAILDQKQRFHSSNTVKNQYNN